MRTTDLSVCDHSTHAFYDNSTHYQDTKSHEVILASTLADAGTQTRAVVCRFLLLVGYTISWVLGGRLWVMHCIHRDVPPCQWLNFPSFLLSCFTCMDGESCIVVCCVYVFVYVVGLS